MTSKMFLVKLLALALTNLVPDLVNLVIKWPTLALANLVTHLTKPILDLDKIWARLDTIIKQTTPPHPTTTRKLFKAGNLEVLLSDSSEFQLGELE